MSHTFAITKIEGNPRRAVGTVLDRVNFPKKAGKSVFLKPNFTYPFFKPGVTTTREVLVAAVEYLKDLGVTRVVIGEGDGGYNAFSMEQTFKNYRLDELVKSHGVEVVNSSKWPSMPLDVRARRGNFVVNLPRPLFEEFDAFITLPVPKVHAMTTISNAVKNQWGLVQDVMRLHFHCAFDEIITELCRRLPNAFALVDGTYGLTRNGPMIEGITLDLGWVSACDNLWMNDRLMCEMMRMPMEKVEHLMYAQGKGLMPERATCALPADFASYVDDRFYLKRNFWNYVAKSTWYSRSWNHFVYFGRLSTLLHKVMYSIRQKPQELSAKGVDWK
jgi:uncharacterized protein (DUF362 family)